MKNFLLFGMILLIALNFTSCKSTRNMKYFQDLNTELKGGIPIKASEYLIKSDDNLYIDIKSQNPEVSQLFSPSKSVSYTAGTSADFGLVSSQYLNGYPVSQKGMILLPVIGEVSVIGMTEEGARYAIQKRVGEYYKDVTIKVLLLNYKVTVLGEVKNPGIYYNYDKSINILEAIGMANGTTDAATIKKILVIRPTTTGNRSYRLDLTEKKVMTSEAFFLLPNDVVYVEPDKYKNLPLNSTIFTIALSAISSAILVLSYINK